MLQTSENVTPVATAAAVMRCQALIRVIRFPLPGGVTIKPYVDSYSLNRHHVTCQSLFEGYVTELANGGNAAAYERSKGKRYAETFRCPGGALCLDFCNTGQGLRGARQEEWIAGFGDLIDWLEAAGAITRTQAERMHATGARSPRAARALWERAIEFREALARILLTRAEGRAPAGEDLRIIEAEYARTASFARLTPSGDGFAWTLDASAVALDAALEALVESAAGLLTSGRLSRVRRCGNSTCYWLFIDETKNCSRRWCEMASCGNLMKVRRHRAKRRDGSGG